MTSSWISAGINLALAASISAIVAGHYRDRSYPSSQRYDTFWPRFWSGCVDGLVLWPLTAVGLVLGSFGAAGGIIAGFTVFETIAHWTYIIWLHGRYGATVGKMTCRVRILSNASEEPITFKQAFIREAVPVLFGLGSLVWYISAAADGKLRFDGSGTDVHFAAQNRSFWLFGAMPLIWFVAEVLTMLTNPKRRALHDFIAGTVVVRTNAEVENVGVAMVPAPRLSQT
jgi:uncharacterized RDD family membrane protein YckC